MESRCFFPPRKRKREREREKKKRKNSSLAFLPRLIQSLDWEGVRKHARQLLLLEQKKDNVDGQGEALYRLTLALSEGKLHREAIQVCALYASFCEDCGSPNDIRWAEHHAIALINKVRKGRGRQTLIY